MKTIRVGSDLIYQVNQPTSFLFQIAVAGNEHQNVREESLTVVPQIPMQACQVGLMGNRTHRLFAEPGEISIQYRATVDLQQRVVAGQVLQEIPHAELPAEVLTFLNPSRYCESDKLLQLAWDEFGQERPGHDRVQQIVDWVYDLLTYTPGSTGPTTTACDVLLQRTGVCRDYAHVCIALCRAMGVPARYVAGYAVNLEPPDFHGFFEAYLGGDWFLFDATKLAPVEGFVRIGAGRDAADVSFSTYVGSAVTQKLSVWANSDDPNDPPRTSPHTDAVSTA